MPVYEYEGVHYELPDGLSNEQALSKIKSHADQSATQSQIGKIGDFAGGIIETGTTGVLDAIGGLGASVYGAAKGALSDNSTASQGRDEATKAYSESAIGKTLSPKTHTGEAINEWIGKQIDQLKDDAGEAYINQIRPDAPDVIKNLGKGMATAVGSIPEASMLTPFGHKPKGEVVAKPKAKGLDVDGILKDTGMSDKPDISADVARLHDEDIKRQLQELDERLNTPVDLDVGQPAVPATKNTLPHSGEDPIYVDPQGQAFRGDPDKHGPSVALDMQTEAMDTALQHPEQLAKATNGNPLPLIDRESFRSSNEGVHPGTPEQTLNAGMAADEHAGNVESNIWVEKQAQRVAKQEELVIKLAEQVQKGEIPASRLAREKKNLEAFEAALEKTKQNVSDGYREGQPALPFNYGKSGRQRGAINPDVLKKGFWRMKLLPDGTKLSAEGKNGQELQITATKDGHVVSAVTFDPRDVPEHGTTNLEAFSVATHPDHRGKGYATELYKFAQELGNDIMPSFARTEDGKKMWEHFTNKGMVSSDGVIPARPKSADALKDLLKASANDGTHIGNMAAGRSQRGALLIDPEDRGKAKFLSEHPATKLNVIVPEFKDMPVEKVAELAKGVPDVDQNFVQKAINVFTKGGLYQALKTDHPVVKFVYEKSSEADRLARGEIQKWVHDKLAPASRELNLRAKAEIWEAIDRADFHKKELSEDILRRNGASEAQINYWKTHREVMDRVFNGLNNVREALGMEPIDRRVAYAAMRSTGNYRRLIYQLDKEGERQVVGIVGSDYRNVLNKRLDALREKHPEYVIGPEEYFGGVPRDKGNAAAAMMQTLELLGKEDPHIGEFMKKYGELTSNEVYNFLNMKKHTMEKKGIFGMEGRKDWVTAEQNAKEGMQAQINYAEAGLKWEALAREMVEVNKLLGDPKVQEMAPNAVKWAKDYSMSALGYNPTVGRYLEQYFAKAMEHTGVGYGVARRGIAMARKTVNATLLGLNPAFILTNFVQPFKAMPGMKAYLASKGLDHLSTDLGTGYRYFSNATMTLWREHAGEPLTVIEYGALQYGKTHHVYGSDLIEHSNSASKTDTLRIPYTNKSFEVPGSYYLDKVSSYGANQMETATRKLIYLADVQMLHENGLSVKDGLYEAAHNLTDMAMNNYSRSERAPIYNMLGPIGETAGNLASYKHNELSRIALFARQLSENKGLVNKVRPLATELAATIFYAGMLGIPGYQALDKLYDIVTTHLLHKPRSLTLDIMKASEEAAKAVKPDAKESQYILSHGIFSMAKVDMSKRLGLQQLWGDNAADTGFPGISRIGGGIHDAAKAAIDPTEMNLKRAVRNAPFMPQPVSSNLDLEWFSKGGMSHNADSLKAGVRRNDADIVAKRLGFTGIHESVARDKLYETDTIKEAYRNLRVKPLEHARDELYSGKGISPETVKMYVEREGDVNTLLTDINRFAKEQAVPAYERELLKNAMSKSITSLKHAQRLQSTHQP
jgi:GNAT superfamily N-acetyltransferase